MIAWTIARLIEFCNVSNLTFTVCSCALFCPFNKLEIPPPGIASGDNFGYGPGIKLGNEWSTFEGVFSLSTDGEQVFLFCISGGGEFYPLAGLSYNGEFSPPGLPSYQFNESAVPDSLVDASIVLNPHKDNCAFTSRVEGSKDEVRLAFLDSKNWECNDNARFKSTNPPRASGGWPSRISNNYVGGSVLMVVMTIAAPLMPMLL